MDIQKTAREMANRLKADLQAENVWLFGSQARGDGGADSDIDLLAIISHSSVTRYNRALAARRILSDFHLPLDVIVLTQAEWNKEIKAPCSLPSTVLREGILL